MNYHKNRGFSLAEAMLATLLLGIATAGLLLPFSTGASIQAEGNKRTLAAKLGCDLMEEIINTPFDSIVGTYNGYTELKGMVRRDTRKAGFLSDVDARYNNFSRTVSCGYVYISQQTGLEPPIFIRVTVKVYYNDDNSVYYNSSEIVSLSRLIGDYDADSTFESYSVQ
ncbi:MAG: type IV pilus modification PilV family protein [Planctomycetota bacterium]|jgi:hypothetical protein